MLVFDTASLNIGFLIYLIYHLSIISLHRPSTNCLLAFCFNITCIWYSKPQHRIFDLFDLLSIVSLHRPSTHHLLAFHFNIACIWYSEPQHKISDLFGLLSIVSLHHPSIHCLLAFRLLLEFDSASLNLFLIYFIFYCLCHCPSTHHPFILLCCLYLIQQSPYPGLLLSLPRFGTLFACCQFMLWLLLSFVLHLNRTIPESSWIVQFHPISSSLATSKLILPR